MATQDKGMVGRAQGKRTFHRDREDAMRKIWDWFIRDTSRDELTDALNAWGVGATMAERGRHEEGLKREGEALEPGVFDAMREC